jgi:hypothetical protein
MAWGDIPILQITFANFTLDMKIITWMSAVIAGGDGIRIPYSLF